MSAIETSSRQISQIIGVIDEIAFQTNLLALNAGSRPHGPGTPAEVRRRRPGGPRLAQRSAEAAKEIKALISASPSRWPRASNWSAGRKGAGADRRPGHGHQYGGRRDLRLTKNSRRACIRQHRDQPHDQATQQNAAMVEQSTAASHSLAQDADEMVRRVSQFRVDGETASAAQAVRRRA